MLKNLRKKSKVTKKVSVKTNKKSGNRRKSKRVGSKRVKSKRVGSKRATRRNSKSVTSKRVTSKRGSRKFKMDTRRYKKAVTIDRKPQKHSGLDFPDEFYESVEKQNKIRELKKELSNLKPLNFLDAERIKKELIKTKMELEVIRNPVHLDTILRSQRMYQHRKDKNYDEDDEDDWDEDIRDVEDDMDEYDFCDSDSCEEEEV